MKNFTLLITLLCASSILVVYADTVASTSPQNTQAATTAPAKTQQAPEKEKKPTAHQGEGSPSVYDSVKSGWNSFLDLLTGPTTN